MEMFAQTMARLYPRSTRKSGPKMFLDVLAAHDARRTARAAAVLSVTKTAVNTEKRLITGWASVATMGGKDVIDLQGDVLSIEEIRAAAHDYIRGSRPALLNHAGEAVAEVVETFVADEAVQKALGVDFGRTGWLVTMYVSDDATWARVKAGELAAFSIGGMAIRE
ncbi:hypothetical protein GXW78_12325 [Roseomonas terrae]|uniref:Phage-like element PBSX protein XkdF domain-containing protein n=1 Tax=Neoroseomonas terrae TaxID=424799 RepID=A0ABS5EHG9_9PROT|nr:XkdF-like putative serine protease domain-containing protein [Neoroseomonas terrae]MBR0650453.1 hypothetical protein [Neoroseomonas terrae]